MTKLKKRFQLLLKLSCFLLISTTSLSDRIEGKGLSYEEALADAQARAIFVIFGELSTEDKTVVLNNEPFKLFKVVSKHNRKKEFKVDVDYQPIDGIDKYKLLLKLKRLGLNIQANIVTPTWVKYRLSEIGVDKGSDATIDIKVNRLHLSISDPFESKGIDKKFDNREELWDAVIDFLKMFYDKKTYRLDDFSEKDILDFKSNFAVDIVEWNSQSFVQLPQTTIFKENYKLENNVIKVRKTVDLSLENVTFEEFDKVEATIRKIGKEIAFDFNRKKASLTIYTFLNKDELVKFFKGNKIDNKISEINYR